MTPSVLELACDRAVAAVEADGASARVHVAAGSSCVYASDATATGLDAAEESAGEGPSTTAFTTRRPVLVSDLRAAEAGSRWPGLQVTLGEVGVGRLVALPLMASGLPVGVLSLYSRLPGQLSPPQWAAALDAADDTTTALLAPNAQVVLASDYRCHQATGMVIAHTGQDAASALALLRARAFREGVRLDELTIEVIARRVTFEQED
jgi:hypothetical protein